MITNPLTPPTDRSAEQADKLFQTCVKLTHENTLLRAETERLRMICQMTHDRLVVGLDNNAILPTLLRAATDRLI